MNREEAQKKAQELLAEAKSILEVVTDLAMQHELDGLSFMNLEFHTKRKRYYGGDEWPLRNPGWFHDMYWESSTAGCNLDIVYPDEEV